MSDCSSSKNKIKFPEIERFPKFRVHKACTDSSPKPQFLGPASMLPIQEVRGEAESCRFNNYVRRFCCPGNANHTAKTTALRGKHCVIREDRGSCWELKEYRTDHKDGQRPCRGVAARLPTPNCSTSSPRPCQKQPFGRPGNGRSSWLVRPKANLLPADRAIHIPAAPTQSQASGHAERGHGLSPENQLVLISLLKITSKTQVHFKLCLRCPQSDFLETSKAVGMFSCFITLLA